jgi:hypothetical protein
MTKRACKEDGVRLEATTFNEGLQSRRNTYGSRFRSANAELLER